MLPTTTSLMLAHLREPGHAAWGEFDARYRPVLEAFARRVGLGDADAEEVAQEVLATFAAEHRRGRYDPARGRLRSWLFRIARARVADRRRSHGRRAAWRGESALEAVPDEDALERLFEEEWRREMLRVGWSALERGTRTDARTLQVFRAVAFEARPTQEVAQEFGLEPNAVYQIKARVMARLRGILAELEGDA